MAQKVETIFIDDLDGSEASETVSFGLDGTAYEIDLKAANARVLRDALEPFVSHGRKAGKLSGSARSNGKGRSKSASNGHGPDPATVREWAGANGITVNAKGRVPADVTAQFMAAQQQPVSA